MSLGFEIEDNEDELIRSAEDAPIVKLVNSIVASAIAREASDIHIEPQESIPCAFVSAWTEFCTMR